MNRTRWIIFAAVCVALLGFLVYQGSSSMVTFKSNPAKITKEDYVYGNPNAEVVFIEYGDFQCPLCGELYRPLKKVKDDYREKVAFVYRYLPLETIHSHALAAAKAAAAAGKQGKFWAMHNKLYANQDEWGSNQVSDERAFQYFVSYAKSIDGLDVSKWREAFKSKAVAQRVKRDLAAAQKAGLRLSTPTVVINGETINLHKFQKNGFYSADKIREVLNSYLKKAGVEPPKKSEIDPNSKPATPDQAGSPKESAQHGS